MAIIRNITTGNTFQQHVTTTSETVQKLNHLTDGAINDKFYANTDIVVDGNLDVTGNISLDAAGFDNLTMNGDLILTTSDSSLYVTQANTSGTASARYEVYANSGNFLFKTQGTTPRVKPPLYFKAGSTYAFDLQNLSSSHPFAIRSTNDSSGANINFGLTFVQKANNGNRLEVFQGAAAQGRTGGILYFKVPETDNLTGAVYYYNCTVHAGMGNSITVENTVQAAFNAANNAVSDALALSIAMS